jgi:hypothetical protein
MNHAPPRATTHHQHADGALDRRDPPQISYNLSPEYRALFTKVLAYARETAIDPADGGIHRQRVRWWAALGLLRALASSPSAAAETLRSRAKGMETTTVEEADEIGRRTVLDLTDDESAEGMDVSAGADTEEGDDREQPNRRRLRALAAEADALKGPNDAKLERASKLVKKLVADGYNPIVFCRFIATADYVAGALRKALPNAVRVEAVTGVLHHTEREQRVLALGEADRRVLVATDCLSEGINLQDYFDAVVHYDLAWNPTRHEQREGRVDRFGQKRDTVRVLTYFGRDNGIDGIVLDVLLHKHKAIRDSLGISVPVPVDSNAVVEAILEGLVMRGRGEQLSLFDQPELRSVCDAFHDEWQQAADREKRSRTVFAQETIKVDEVAHELEAVREAIGSEADVRRFTTDALRAEGATVSGKDPVTLRLDEVSRALRDQLGPNVGDELRARFELPVGDGVTYLARTHPVVEGLAAYVLDTALDPIHSSIARRAGTIRTRAVARRTTALLIRSRFDVVTRRDDDVRRMLAEECRLVAFVGAPEAAEWLDDGKAEALLAATPDDNVPPEQARSFVRRVIDGYPLLAPQLADFAAERAEQLRDSHLRVRKGAHLTDVHYAVEPKLPPDVLGAYVFLPMAG